MKILLYIANTIYNKIANSIYNKIDKMSKQIHERLTKFVIHKTYILVERIYLAVIDKIYDAENYDQFDMDSENNIYVTYSLKKDEHIITDANEIISEQIIKKYRKKLEEKLEEEGYFVEYEDSEIHVYFEKPLKIDNLSDVSSIDLNDSEEKNILKYTKKPNIKIAKATLLNGSENSGIFDFGAGED
jgi:hypothetical protein